MTAPYGLVSLRDVLDLPIGELLATYQRLHTFGAWFSVASARDETFRIGVQTHRNIVEAATKFEELCLQTTLAVTAGAARELRNQLQRYATPGQDDPNYIPYEGSEITATMTFFEQLAGCLKLETATKTAMMLPPEKLRLFSPSEPLYGSEVGAKFPSLLYDIEEAGKCLALGRSTAAAFHAIRCLEGGIIAISRFLGIPDPIKGSDRNWGAMLKKVQAEIDRRWVGAASRFSGDGAYFEGLYGVLAAMQNPYRNGTMHLDQKYTEEEAKHVFDMVAGVMRKIASRMDENGCP